MIRVELPFPPADLFPNRANGRHWTAVRQMKDTAKEIAYVLTRAAAGPRDKPLSAGDVPLAITFHAPDKRRRDRDNCLAAAKHQLDGVALALGIDDAQFEPLTVRRGEPVKGGLMVLEIGQRPLKKSRATSGLSAVRMVTVCCGPVLSTMPAFLRCACPARGKFFPCAGCC